MQELVLVVVDESAEMAVGFVEPLVQRLVAGLGTEMPFAR